MEGNSGKLETEAGCSTSPQFVDQGDESDEDGIEDGNSKARDETDRVDSSGEHTRNCLNSRLDNGEFFADHIGSLAQTDGESGGVVFDSEDSLLSVDGHGGILNGDSTSRHDLSHEGRHRGHEVTQSREDRRGQLLSIGGSIYDALESPEGGREIVDERCKTHHTVTAANVGHSVAD